MAQDDPISIKSFLDRYARLVAKTERVTRVGRWLIELPAARMWWSPEVYRLHGVDPATFNLTHESVVGFYTPETRERIERAIKESARNGEPFDLEFPIQQPDGHVLWVRTSGFAEETADGKLEAAGLIQDIHERVIQRTERQLYYDLSPDLLCLVEPDSRFRQVNPSMARALGYSEQELIGRPFFDFVHPDDLQSTHDVFANSKGGHAVESFENRWITRSGQVLWLQWRAIADPATHRVYGSARNITHEKLAQEQLARDAQILANITHMVVVTDAQGIVTYWNHEAERILGWSAQEMVGRHYSIRLKPELIAQANHIRQEIVEGNEVDREWLDQHRTGRQVWLRVRSRRLLDQNGRLAGTISVGTDITSIKEAEERLRLLLNEIDHRVKNNLASVISIARQTASTSASLKQFQTAFEARIHGLVLSHITLTEHKWKSVPLDSFLGRVIAPFTTDRAGQLHLSGPRVLLAPDLVSPLGMAFNELATNAFKYGGLSVPGGQVDVRWELPRPRLLQLRWVESNGPAVSANSEPHTGMAVIRGLIEYQLGGHIEFDFKPDGLSVLITLPLEAKAEPEAASP